MADISSIKLNGNSYNIKDNNAVSKSGDTMTGTLIMTNNGAFRVKDDVFNKNVVPVSNVTKGPFNVRDANDATIASIRVHQTTDKEIGIGLNALNKDVLTTYVKNDDNKTVRYSIENPDAFCNAINAVAKDDIIDIKHGGTGATTFTSGAALIGNGTNAITTRSITNNTSKNYITANTNLITANTLGYWNGAYNNSGSSNISYLGTISGGTWQGNIIGLNYGGTGVSTATANYVFAAPAANNGTPGFRKLIADDIPGLNASKITAGTLSVGRGGTGVTTYSALAPKVGISTLQIATTKSDTYTFKSNTNGEFAIIFCGRGGRAGIYMVDYNTANSIKVFNVGSIDPLITIQHSANSKDITITNNNSVTMKITIIEMDTTN